MHSSRYVAAIIISLAILFPSISSSLSQEVEFRQLHPNARKLLVDEIRLELDAENERRHAVFMETLGSWARIGSGAFGALVALLGIAGWRGLASLRNNIKNDLIAYVSSDPNFERAVESRLRSVVETVSSNQNEKMRRELNLARLEMMTRKVEESDSFSDAERYAMQDLLISVSTDQELRTSNAFTGAAQSVVKNLRSAQLDNDLDRLDNALQEFFVGERRLTQLFVVHYGDRLLEKDELDADLSQNFQTYAKASRGHKNLDWLPYELIMASKFDDKKSEKRITSLLKEARFLSEDDKQWLFQKVKNVTLADDQIDNYRYLKEVEATKSFWDRHGAQLAEACDIKLDESSLSKPGTSSLGDLLHKAS